MKVDDRNSLQSRIQSLTPVSGSIWKLQTYVPACTNIYYPGLSVFMFMSRLVLLNWCQISDRYIYTLFYTISTFIIKIYLEWCSLSRRQTPFQTFNTIKVIRQYVLRAEILILKTSTRLYYFCLCWLIFECYLHSI